MTRYEGRCVWQVAALALSLGIVASIAGADIIMVTPTESQVVRYPGDTFDIVWEGADGNSTLQLWHGSESGWEIMPGGEAVPDYTGKYTWQITDDDIGKHAFGAWVDAGDGNWYLAEPIGLVDVLSPLGEEEPMVSFLTPSDPEGEVVYKAVGPYEIQWEGGSQYTQMDVWVGGESGWTKLASVTATDGSYLWDVGSDEFPDGTYNVGAWVKDGATGSWYDIYAVGSVELTSAEVPEPTTMAVFCIGAMAVLVRRRRT